MKFVENFDYDQDQDGSLKNRLGSKTAILTGAVGVIAVIAALIIGFCIGSGGFGAKGVSATKFDDSQLDNVVATWSYNGSKQSITARQVLEGQYSLDKIKDNDGNYSAPTGDIVLAFARNQVLLQDAKDQGISLSDDDLNAAAEESLGTSDWSQIASKYGVSEEQAKNIVREQVTIEKLYKSVIGDAPSNPTAPTEPENGNNSAMTEAYAQYIIELAGDEWDADAKTWKSSDGTVASALADDSFNGETASYEMAQKAYEAVYQAYSSKASENTTTWKEYVNKVFAKSNVTIYGLYA